jgi:hypothetical protein
MKGIVRVSEILSSLVTIKVETLNGYFTKRRLQNEPL